MNELLYKDIKTGRFIREFSHSFIHTEKGLLSSINTEFIKLNHEKKKSWIIFKPSKINMIF